MATYRNGSRASGSDRAPGDFPAWLAEDTAFVLAPENRDGAPSLVALDDGRLTLAAAFADGEGGGTVAIFGADLEDALSASTETWVTLLRSDDPLLEPAMTLEIFDETYFLVPPQIGESPERRALLEDSDLAESSLLVVGFERVGAVYSLATGTVATGSVSANLYSRPIAIYRHLFSGASKIDAFAWLAFLIPAFLLFDVYVLAVAMAVYLILSLSRAVNRLTRGTEAVKRGEFATRIPARRKDQIGDLQRSFNDMTGNLESLVAQAAQKEILDKELEIAHDLQRSLIPQAAVEVPGAEFATAFEPSLAIGGDYFDIVRLRDDTERLAVVIADVAGHGLPAGLRMAMLKAAVQILVRERKDPERILESLDEIVRSDPSRAFVTATVSLIDLRTGRVDITNAGHPPIYRVRGDEVEEILLPSTPARHARPQLRHRPPRARGGRPPGVALGRPDRDNGSRRRSLRLRASARSARQRAPRRGVVASALDPRGALRGRQGARPGPAGRRRPDARGHALPARRGDLDCGRRRRADHGQPADALTPQASSRPRKRRIRAT